eukprot:1584379-Amphidinium_carterae.2
MVIVTDPDEYLSALEIVQLSAILGSLLPCAASVLPGGRAHQLPVGNVVTPALWQIQPFSYVVLQLLLNRDLPQPLPAVVHATSSLILTLIDKLERLRLDSAVSKMGFVQAASR